MKFTVTLASACTVAGVSGNIGQVIIAGDGYGYLPYSCVGNGVNYLGTYRVGSGGAWDNIAVASSPNSRGERIAPPYVITNADTGVLLSWEDVPTGAKMLAVTTGTAVRVTSGPVISGQGSGAVAPMLQAQDGSFVGMASVGSAGTPYMVAFDASGAVRWTAANETPRIATADGGVIAESGAVYDASGAAVGRLASLPVQSWTGNVYQVGSVEQLVVNWIDLAVSFWALSGGNASGNRAANLPAARAVQTLIGQIADYYTGAPQNLNWVGRPGNQCNSFVRHIISEAGIQAPLSFGTRYRAAFPRLARYFDMSTASYPASAGDWAFPHTTLRCWQNVPAPGDRLNLTYPADVSRTGDVIAEGINYSDASGHVGIVGGVHQTVSADAAAHCISPSTPNEIIDITDYGFRPDGWQSPQLGADSTPCSRSGWKSKAVVKRFVCQ